MEIGNKEKGVCMSKEMYDLEKMCKPIQDYVKQNFHPHVSIIITDEDIRAEETLMRCPVKQL